MDSFGTSFSLSAGGRSIDASFCSGNTTNFTNGYALTWLP
jgi:hypothetical protein